MNLEKYNKVLSSVFNINDINALLNLEYQSIELWDSIGHMELIVMLEEEFGISFETDDIIDFSSYSKGIEILKKYNVEFSEL
jgi:acyl carrier protein